MDSRFTVQTKSLDYLPIVYGKCRVCDQPVVLDDGGICDACSEAEEECVICHRGYSVSDEYEDENICRGCNPYYKKYRKASAIFSLLWRDILSFYAENRTKEIVKDASVKELLNKILKMVLDAKKEIGKEDDK